MPNYDKILTAMNPPVCRVDMEKLLKMIYNCYILDEVPRIFHGKVDRELFAHLYRKAEREQGNHVLGWIGFILNLEPDLMKIVADYVDELEI